MTSNQYNQILKLKLLKTRTYDGTFNKMENLPNKYRINAVKRYHKMLME